MNRVRIELPGSYFGLETASPLFRLYLRAMVGVLCVVPACSQITLAGWIETDKLVADDSLPGSWTGLGGKGVDISGDTIILGAPQPNSVGPGEAYVFQNTGADWPQIAELSAVDGDTNDDFGKAVAIDGTTAVVSAPGEDALGGNAGAAYVFELNNSTWQQVAKLTASDGVFSDSFGSDVAIHGNTIVIGANHDQDQGHFTGAAYVFQNSGSGWSETAKLTASDQAEFDGFGHAVAIDGNTILIGAVGEGNREGSVYVFEDNGLNWEEVDKLTASDPVGEAGGFGVSLDIEDGRAAIGRYLSDESGTSSGSAYVFEELPAGWTETAKLTALDAEAGDSFGISVGLNGDTIVVGSYLEDEINSEAGAAYIFEYVGTSWTEVDKLTIPTGGVSDLFGYSVAIDGGNAIITSLGDDQAGNNAGAAHVFSRADIPEPSSSVLVLLGAPTLLGIRRKEKYLVNSSVRTISFMACYRDCDSRHFGSQPNRNGRNNAL